LAGFALLGFSGYGAYTSLMHLCNLFPGHQAAVLSFFSGTFSASSLIFKLMEILHRANSKTMSMGTLFLGYIVVLTPFFLFGAFIWPNVAYGSEKKKAKIKKADDNHDESTPLMAPSESTLANNNSAPNDGTLRNKGFVGQIKSFKFWIPVFWIALQNLCISFYMGTVETRFPHSNMPSIFNWTYSFGWMVIPLYGLLMDRTGVNTSFLFASISLFTFCVINMVPNRDVQYLNFVIASTAVVAMWGTVYTYLSEQFGFSHYGKLLAVMNGLNAAIGLLQFPMATFTIENMNGNFRFVDTCFVATSLLCLVCPIYLFMTARKTKSPSTIEYYPVNVDPVNLYN